MKTAVKVIAINLIGVLIILALYEGFLFALIGHPDLLRKCPMGLRNSIGYLYNNGDRRIIQFSPDCARFDKNLGYTLKPGQCIFSGSEFSNTYWVNSAGLRDDESSLDHPEIIVTGDSFAMGWGVEKEETYAQLLERKTRLRVLNAAISSYGTAREMLALRRIPTDRLRYLIIQYCENDREENLSFYLNGNTLNTMSEDQYLRYASLDARDKSYFPGKYLKMQIEKRVKESRRKKSQTSKPVDLDEVDLFINAITQSGVNLKRVQLIVFVMNGRIADDNRAFPAALKKKIADGNYPDYIRRMIVLDLSDALNESNFYVLDDHMNRSGHEIVVDVLYQTLSR
ncbi:MAG: hypothetical protein PHQ63_08515 [Smithellaceae bacterium]|nr:hypothetical protein [Smithellaceae bacterium]